jgi:hypothetical protein
MPAVVIGDPPGISCTFSDGTGVTWRALKVSDRVLVCDLLGGLAGVVHPHGPVDAAKTVGEYGFVIRAFARTLAGLGHRGPLAGLGRGRLTEALLGLGHRPEMMIRRVLAACDPRDAGPEVREVVLGRPFSRFRPYVPAEPYSEGEWERLQAACSQVAGAALAAFREAAGMAASGRDPLAYGWTEPNTLHLLARRGPLTVADLARLAGVSQDAAKYLAGGIRQRNTALFPATGTVIAYQLLFGCCTGIVPDGISGLGIGDLDWAGDGAVQVDYVKGRTSAESLTLPRPAVRLLEQWLEHSALLRSFAPPELRGRLWLRRDPAGHAGSWHAGKPDVVSLRKWAARRGLADDQGQPLRIHRHRIRTTFESRRDRAAWFGSTRATIDPNHSPQLEGDYYLTTTTAAQRDAVEAIIEDAQADLLRKARPPVVLTAEQAAGAAAALPAAVAGMGLDGTAIGELTGGARDVFAAACADPLSGLHGPAGKPCPARPWVCLLCPLAVFTPRHAVNVMRLKSFFARQWRQMPAARFMTVFGPYAQRADEVIDAFRRLDPALAARAAAEAGDSDATIALRPEERTP